MKRLKKPVNNAGKATVTKKAATKQVAAKTASANKKRRSPYVQLKRLAATNLALVVVVKNTSTATVR